MLLDEIGDLEESLQAKLLRVLNGERQYRLGGEGNDDYAFVFRGVIILATWRGITDKALRPDLRQRVLQNRIRVPSLSEYSPVSPRAVSQIDSLIAHQLSAADDIAAVTELMQTKLPERMRVNDVECDLSTVLRSLDTGMAVVSSATLARTLVMEVRPRVVAHGGKAF